MPTILSPIERAVLHSCEHASSIREIAADLELEGFSVDGIRSACAFMRRRLLLEENGSYYRQTELGARVLARQEANERAASAQGSLRLV